MSGGVPGGPPLAGNQPGRWRRLLGFRVWLYLLVILFILSFRYNPAFRSFWSGSKPGGKGNVLVLAGLDLAPALVPGLVAGYRVIRPEAEVRLLGGGTRQALEMLANNQADAVFLNRLPTGEEKRAMAVAVDSIWSYPVALGGVAVLCGRNGGPDSLTLADLKSWLGGEEIPGRTRPTHFYVPDPNLGLWTVLTSSLGVADAPGGDASAKDVVFLVDENAVLQAVGAEGTSLGFASTFSLPAKLDTLGVRMVRVRGTGTTAVLPLPGDIAAGRYPLYHYLYLSCRPDPDRLTRSFADFMVNGRGQRLVEREGYLPARQVGRIVQLTKEPVIAR